MDQTPIELADRIADFCKTVPQREMRDADGVNRLAIGFHAELKKAAAGKLTKPERDAIRGACESLLSTVFSPAKRRRKR